MRVRWIGAAELCLCKEKQNFKWVDYVPYMHRQDMFCVITLVNHKATFWTKNALIKTTVRYKVHVH